MKESTTEDLNTSDKKAIQSIKISRAIWPILIGVGVVGYLFWKQFDINDFNKINWTTGACISIGLAFFIMGFKHLSYATRLYILSEKRASAIKTLLEERGIQTPRLRTRGYGPSKPINSGNDDESRAQNRRVEVIITKVEK